MQANEFCLFRVRMNRKKSQCTILTRNQVLPNKVGHKKIPALKARPATKFKDVIHYSSFLSNSN